MLRFSMAVLWLLTLLDPVVGHAEISRNTYHAILDVVGQSYAAAFQERRERLRIDRLWRDDTNQASAWREEDRRGEIAVLRIPGGIARQSLINADAFTLIICHEIGHHLAGPPAIWKYSVEGQADYFGVSDCLRRVLPKLPEFSVTREESTPRIVARRCREVFAGAEARSLCMRSAMAGARLTRYFADKRHIGHPRFETPDPTVRFRTNMGLPSPQCRLDTYFAAALCDPEQRETTADPPAWLCTGPSHADGVRPRCWFSAAGSG